MEVAGRDADEANEVDDDLMKAAIALRLRTQFMSQGEAAREEEREEARQRAQAQAQAQGPHEGEVSPSGSDSDAAGTVVHAPGPAASPAADLAGDGNSVTSASTAPAAQPAGVFAVPVGRKRRRGDDTSQPAEPFSRPRAVKADLGLWIRQANLKSERSKRSVGPDYENAILARQERDAA